MREPDSGRAKALVWLLAAVSLFTRAAFMHHGGMPDADSTMIAAGVALGATGDLPFSETFLYGRQLNPGVFLFMRAAYPALWSNPAHVVAILNWIAVVCGALAVLPLYDLFRLYLSPRVALACAGIWAFTPLVWNAQTSFHPVIPATFFLLLALTCARRVDRARMGPWYFLGACLFAGAAVITRSDVAVVWPAVAVFALTASRKRRALLTLVACSAVTAFVYALVLNATAGTMETGGKSIGHFWDRYGGMYGMSFSLHGIPRSLAWAGMGLGIATLVACAVGLIRFLRTPRADRRALPLCAALLWSLPSIVFWVPYIVPVLRHYYLPSIGFVWLAGFLIMRGMNTRRLVTVSLAVIVLNLLLPEVLYRGYNRTHASAKAPYGSFFYSHQAESRNIERLAGLRESALTCARSHDERVRSIVLCRWDGYANVMAGVASGAHSVTRLAENAVFPEVVLSHYTSDRADVQLIRYLYMEDPVLRDKVSALLMNAWKEGYCVFIPRSVPPFETLREQPGVYYYP